jgi:hypothetical protein
VQNQRGKDKASFRREGHFRLVTNYLVTNYPQSCRSPGAASQLGRFCHGSGQHGSWNQLRDPISRPYLVNVGQGGHQHHDLSAIRRIDHAPVGEHTFGCRGWSDPSPETRQATRWPYRQLPRRDARDERDRERGCDPGWRRGHIRCPRGDERLWALLPTHRVTSHSTMPRCLPIIFLDHLCRVAQTHEYCLGTEAKFDNRSP